MNFENIHNYYEKLVLEHLQDALTKQQGITDQDLLEDVACVALNRLPTRYVRHDVDTAFFTSDEEWQRMEKQVAAAVAAALDYVRERGDMRD
ncbi:late competence development ComFB family protein [Sulfurivermis fontis]|uniref:late competence development ComFB family protein n=1 Tax=Sulfurivermis fontis TaxID=1972068 RepID=UPI000FD996E8|nr:late competence development ComFB family protein [Sulfurivermis fontis]